MTQSEIETQLKTSKDLIESMSIRLDAQYKAIDQIFETQEILLKNSIEHTERLDSLAKAYDLMTQTFQHQINITLMLCDMLKLDNPDVSVLRVVK